MPAPTRRDLLTAAAVSLCPAARAAAQPVSRRRPNILFVYTDDQGSWSLGVEGNRDARTPHTDRLFRQGAHLKNCFVTTPVCSPSRASLLTSRHSTEVGITDYLSFGSEDREKGLNPDHVTWPEVLAEAGYQTALIGKWHLGSLPVHHPTRHGFGHFIGWFTTGSTGPADPELEVDAKLKQFRGSTPDILTDFAIDFIGRRTQQPFLLCLNYREPHASNAPDSAGKDRTWLPMLDQDWDLFRDLDPVIPNPRYPNLDIPRLKRMMREYLGSVASIDRNLGRLLAALEQFRLAADTIVIFTSDNGFNMGHNGIWHKGNGRWLLTNNRGDRPNMFDNSLRVPTAVRWPGVIQAGTVISQTISILDWYPTLLAMAGLVPPQGETIRGHNCLPLLKGEKIPWDNDLYAEYSMRHGVQADLRIYRTPEWKLVRDFRHRDRDELYHLSRDPSETTNLIDSGDAAPQEARRRLESRLREKMREIGDPVLAGSSGQRVAGIQPG
ncbi:MAG: DUF4976 domain-containing protein [Acidobacteria bacterium]|nr:DUF4976 domain-containing protein [Acidobacteriota bacterium]